MKKTLIILSALSILGCKEETPIKDYATLSGKITNKNSDSLVVRTRDYSKTIAVNEDGSFNDTLKVKTGVYNLYDGSESTSVFLKNGFDLNMTIDTKKFDETVKYTGTGSEHSNFLAEKSLKEEQLINFEDLQKITDTVTLNVKFDAIKVQLQEFYNSAKTVDTSLVNKANKSLDPMIKSYKSYIKESIDLKNEFPKGSVSPTFDNYINYDGSKTSLADLSGKYVYVDVWATWCGPCKVEIPFLKQLEEDYREKNIHFVSLSIDDGSGYPGDTPDIKAELAKKGWQEMIAKQELSGIQILAPNGWKSDFIRAYRINGIPRFILIDPEGKVVSPDAPRPSSDELITLFNELGI
ncbi:TlpA family protein disulfide reductase [Bizionia sp. KMM 8389]